MAYTFDKIQSTLEDDQKQNIFGQEQAEKDGGPSFSFQGYTEPNDPITKSVSRAITSPSQGVSVPSSQQQSQTPEVVVPSASEKRQTALDTGGEKAPVPPSLRGLSSSLDAKSAALDTGEDAYLNPFRQTDYGLGKDVLERATAGDEEATAKLTGLFGSGIPEAPEGFELPDVTTPGIQDIQTAGGLEQYLRRQAGPQYTAGEGAFDVSTLSRSPAFLQAATDLAGRETALLQRASDLQQALPGQAQGILGDRLTAAQDAARTGLGGIRSTLDADVMAQLDAARQRRLTLGLPSPFLTSANRYGGLARSSLADATPDELNLDDLILSGKLGIDPTQFYSVPSASEQPLDPSMVTTQDQADQFNRIMSMLGEGGETVLPGSLPEFSSFDDQGYNDALMAAAQAERERLDYVPPAPAPEPEPPSLEDGAPFLPPPILDGIPFLPPPLLQDGIPFLPPPTTSIPFLPSDHPRARAPVTPAPITPDISQPTQMNNPGSFNLPVAEQAVVQGPPSPAPVSNEPYSYDKLDQLLSGGIFGGNY